MSFISFAQNFEDMVLWRTLEHVQYGFYIDIEDRHPVVNSVSKAFHEDGWRGIHIEPVPARAELLRKGRSDETVLQVVLADAEGMLELDVIQDKGLSATVEVYARHHQDERCAEPQRVHLAYAAKAHYELAETFSAPSDAFDDVELNGLASSELCCEPVALHQVSKKMVAAQAEKLTTELLNATKEHITQLQPHAQALQSDSDAANSKINELNPSPYKRTIADRLDQAQQSIYVRKFWRITWSLRRLMRTTRIMEWEYSHA